MTSSIQVSLQPMQQKIQSISFTCLHQSDKKHYPRLFSLHIAACYFFLCFFKGKRHMKAKLVLETRLSCKKLQIRRLSINSYYLMSFITISSKPVNISWSSRSPSNNRYGFECKQSLRRLYLLLRRTVNLLRVLSHAAKKQKKNYAEDSVASQDKSHSIKNRVLQVKCEGLLGGRRRWRRCKIFLPHKHLSL